MRHMTLATALLVVAALAIPAGAQMNQQDKQDKQGQQQGSQQRMAPERQTVQGEITEVRTVKVKETKQDHLMAKVKLDTGKTAMVDFGPADKARQSGLKLEKRQQIEVEGMVGQLNNKPVLIVQRAKQDGKTVMLNADAQKSQGTHGYRQGSPQDSQQENKSGSEQQQQQDMQSGSQQKQIMKSDSQSQDMESGSQSQRMTQVQGQIMDVSTMKSDQDQKEHLVAEIRLEQTGQTVKVDLGPADKAKDSGLKLSAGQQIQVQGAVGRLNGTPVVIVQRAQQDGKTVQLNAGAGSQDKQKQDMQKQDKQQQDMQKQSQ